MRSALGIGADQFQRGIDRTSIGRTDIARPGVTRFWRRTGRLRRLGVTRAPLLARWRPGRWSSSPVPVQRNHRGQTGGGCLTTGGAPVLIGTLGSIAGAHPADVIRAVCHDGQYDRRALPPTHALLLQVEQPFADGVLSFNRIRRHL